jgi:hypothetical protein
VRNIVQGQYTQAIGRKFMEHLPLLPAANSHDLWWEQKAHRNYVKTRRSSNSQTVVVNLQYWWSRLEQVKVRRGEERYWVGDDFCCSRVLNLFKGRRGSTHCDWWLCSIFGGDQRAYISPHQDNTRRKGQREEQPEMSLHPHSRSDHEQDHHMEVDQQDDTAEGCNERPQNRLFFH